MVLYRGFVSQYHNNVELKDVVEFEKGKTIDNCASKVSKLFLREVQKEEDDVAIANLLAMACGQCRMVERVWHHVPHSMCMIRQ